MADRRRKPRAKAAQKGRVSPNTPGRVTPKHEPASNLAAFNTKIDFEALESAAGRKLSPELRQTIQTCLESFHVGRSDRNPTAKDYRDESRLLTRLTRDCGAAADTLVKYRKLRRKPSWPSWPPGMRTQRALVLPETSEDLELVAQWAQDASDHLKRRSGGRPRKDDLRWLINHMIPIAKDAGMSTAYYNDSKGSYEGGLLRMMVEIFRQIGYPESKSLGQMIARLAQQKAQ